jgi:uncharacterized protein (TIGR03437 family)
VVSPTAISFTAPTGGTAQALNCPNPNPANPSFCTISVSSTGLGAGDRLNYQVTFQTDKNINWLLVGSQGGTTTPGILSSVTVSANPALLSAGLYTGTITITATLTGGGAVADSPVTIPVTLQVNAAAMTATPTDLQFSQPAGGPAPQSQTISVSSVPSGASLAYTAVAANSGSVKWLSVDTASASGAAPGKITVNVDGSNLPPGKYTGTVTVTSTTPNIGGSPTVVNVTLTVTPGTISAPTDTLTFAQAAGAAAPPAKTINVTGSPSALNFTVAASTDDGGTWLKATASGSTTPATVTVSVDGGSLQPNTYNGKVTITSAGATGSPITIPVKLTVTSGQTLTVSQSTLNLTYVVGTSAPQSQTVQLTSSGGAAPFTATVSSGAVTWLQVSPTSGNTPATLTLSINPQGLTAASNLTGTVTVSSPAAATPATITVNLSVLVVPKPAPTILVNAATFAAATSVSPGEIVTFGGTNLGPTTGAGAQLDSTGKIATTLGNVRVLFDNVPAPLLFVRADQINAVVPYDVAGHATTSVRLEYQGVQSDATTYNVVAAVPGIFTLNQQGTGPGAILNQDGITVNSANAPAAKLSVVSVYMTGEGQTNPGGVNGAIAPNSLSGLKSPLLQPVSATVGGLTASVKYAGSAPGFVNGAMQVNVEIPANAPSGPGVPIVIMLGAPGAAFSTQAGVTVAVQ